MHVNQLKELYNIHLTRIDSKMQAPVHRWNLNGYTDDQMDKVAELLSSFGKYQITDMEEYPAGFKDTLPSLKELIICRFVIVEYDRHVLVVEGNHVIYGCGPGDTANEH